MNQKTPTPAGKNPASSGLTTRKDRLATALRENLKRRKAQGRARASTASTPSDADKPADRN